MNRHVRALLVVLGLIAIGAVSILAYQQHQQKIVQANIDGPEKTSIELNHSLPEFEAKSIHGQDIKLSQFKGKVVIVNFWASWCGPCVEEIPSLIKLLQAFPNDLELIAISGDSAQEDIDSFVKSFPEMKTQANIHVIFDKDKNLAQLYQIYRLPESFLLNKDLNLVKKISGSIDWHTADALDYLKDLISGQNKNSASSGASSETTPSASNSGTKEKAPEDQD